MSLDVWLKAPQGAPGGSGIFVRQDGQTREITREEWDRLHPGQEPVTMKREGDSEEVFDANITHNLNKMAAEAELYMPLWRPDEIGITRARQLIEPLAKGLELLRSDPERFKRFNPENGWGSYDVFVPWVAAYLEACRRYPDAEVGVWR